MNDLITQLGYQCWVLGPTGYHFDRYMFADMIVRECLSSMEDCDGDLDFAIWKIKNDFGVKE